MLTALGLFAIFSAITYFLILPGGVFFLKRLTLLRVLLALIVLVSGLFLGIYLALQFGKNFPTYQKKIAEVECATDEDSEDVFMLVSYEPAFINKKHNMIAIPSVDGAYKITNKVKKITRKKGE